MSESFTQTQHFLEILATYGLKGVTLVSIGADNKNIQGQRFDLTQLTELHRAVEWSRTQNSQKRGVYWCVAPTKPGVNKKPKKSDVMCSVLCHIDIDPESSSRDSYEIRRNAVMSQIQSIDLEPTLLIDSGHGAYPIWVLREPVKIEEAERVNKLLMKRYDSKNPSAGTWNADRILRLPGTLNWPTTRKVVDYGYPETPSECTLINSSGIVYSLAELEESSSRNKTSDDSQSDPGSIGRAVVTEIERNYQMVLERSGNDLSRGDYAVLANCYERGFAYDQAVELLKQIAPRDKLEREDYLPRTWAAVINHGLVNQLRLPEQGVDLATDTVLANPNQDSVTRLIESLHANELMYVTGLGWFHWKDNCWNYDLSGLIIEFVRRIARRANPRHRAGISSYSFADGVRKFLESSPVFNVPVNQLDLDNYLLGTPDGVVDLRTGEHRTSYPEDRITHCTHVSPADNWKDAKCFSTFLDSVTCGDQELAVYLQKSLGAILCGAVEDHWLLFWMGPGRNGKNTLGDLVLWIMGDYGVVLPSEVLMQQKNEMHSTDLVRLRGARLAVSSEVSEGSYWHESKIKSLTGDSVIAARLMHKDGITFTRSHKHLIYGNHRPQIRTVDRALQGRVHIVPFKADYSPESGNCDPDMPAKLKDDAPYILRWLIDGCLKWQADGKVLKKCAAVHRETDNYFEEQPTLDLWRSECLDPAPGDLDRPVYKWPSNQTLYHNYRNWKELRGEHPKSQTAWSNEMSSRFMKKRHNTGTYFVGAAFKPDDCF